MYDASFHDTSYNTIPWFFLTESYLFIKTQCKNHLLVEPSVLKVHVIFYYRMGLAFPGLGEYKLI